MAQPDHTAAPLPRFPFDTMTGLDAFPLFAQLRQNDPVSAVRLASGGRAYLISRYDDVRKVLTDPAFSREAARRDDVVVLTPASKVPGVLLNMDAPDHTRMRKLIARAFTTRAVERMRPRTREITDGLIDAMIDHGPPADFIPEFAAALPALVISEMLGVPGEDRRQLLQWVDISLSMTHPADEVEAMFGQFVAYLQDLVAAKRAAPADDLTSALIAARDQGDKLSETELLNTVFILIAGGYETTAGLLANSLLVLHRHPGQLALLRDQPELVPAAVEEMLRYVPISWAMPERITLEEVELGGVRIPAHATVIPLTYSANRDDDVIDEPDRFDVTRSALTPNVSFGHGIHRCIGAPLARLELQTAFATLLRRLPAVRPAVAEADLTWKMGMLTIGPTALPVTW